jgi:hypothetical protein
MSVLLGYKDAIFPWNLTGSLKKGILGVLLFIDVYFVPVA